MQLIRIVVVVLGLCLATLLFQQAIIAEAQIFDQLMNGSSNRNSVEEQPQEVGSRFRSMFKDMMSVNVP